MWGPTGSFNTVWVAPNVNRGIRRQTQITAAPPTGSFNGNSGPLDPIVYDQANGASLYRRVLASHAEAFRCHIEVIMIGMQISAPRAELHAFFVICSVFQRVCYACIRRANKRVRLCRGPVDNCVAQIAVIGCVSAMSASCQPFTLTLTMERNIAFRPCFRLRSLGDRRDRGGSQTQPTPRDIMTITLFGNDKYELERFLWSVIRTGAQHLSVCICWIEHAGGTTVLPRCVLGAPVNAHRPEAHTVAWMMHTARVEEARQAIADVCRNAARDWNAEKSFAVEVALRGTCMSADVKRLIKAYVREAVVTDVVSA